MKSSWTSSKRRPNLDLNQHRFSSTIATNAIGALQICEARNVSSSKPYSIHRLTSDLASRNIAFDQLNCLKKGVVEAATTKLFHNCLPCSRSAGGFYVDGNIFYIQRRQHLEAPKEFIRVGSETGA